MRIALVDDDADQTACLARLIDSELTALGYPDVPINAFSDGASFLESWNDSGYDIVILDIFMDGLDGISVARTIRNSDQSARLVFCTSSNDFAAESYEVEARYYLRKPITREGVAGMLARLQLDDMDDKRCVRLPNNCVVPLRSIVFTNYSNHVVTVTLKGADPLKLRTSQAKLEEAFAPYECFFSPIKGVIVNFEEVLRIDGDDFVMSTGEHIHITRRRLKLARDSFRRYRFETMKREALRQ